MTTRRRLLAVVVLYAIALALTTYHPPSRIVARSTYVWLWTHAPGTEGVPAPDRFR